MIFVYMVAEGESLAAEDITLVMFWICHILSSFKLNMTLSSLISCPFPSRTGVAWLQPAASSTVCMPRAKFLKGHGVSSWLTEESGGIPEVPLVENLVFSAMSAV